MLLVMIVLVLLFRLSQTMEVYLLQLLKFSYKFIYTGIPTSTSAAATTSSTSAPAAQTSSSLVVASSSGYVYNS